MRRTIATIVFIASMAWCLLPLAEQSEAQGSVSCLSGVYAGYSTEPASASGMWWFLFTLRVTGLGLLNTGRIIDNVLVSKLYPGAVVTASNTVSGETYRRDGIPKAFNRTLLP